MYRLLNAPVSSEDLVNKKYVDENSFFKVLLNDGQEILLPTENRALEFITDGSINIQLAQGNKILFKATGGGGTGGVPTLVERLGTITIPAGVNQYIPITIGYDKYDIRTLKVISIPAPVVIKIYDNAIESGGDEVYMSHEMENTYDVLNVPLEDKGRKQEMHLYVENKGNIETEVSYHIKMTNLL